MSKSNMAKIKITKTKILEVSCKCWTDRKADADKAFLSKDYEKAWKDFSSAAFLASQAAVEAKQVATLLVNASQMAFLKAEEHLDAVLVTGIQRKRKKTKIEVKARDCIAASEKLACRAIGTSTGCSKAYLLKARALMWLRAWEATSASDADTSYLSQGWARLVHPKLIPTLNVLEIDAVIEKYIEMEYPSKHLQTIKNQTLWQILQLIQHPLYTDFIKSSPAVSEIKSQIVIYIASNGYGCFANLQDAYCHLGRLPISIDHVTFLLSPGTYEGVFSYVNVHNTTCKNRTFSLIGSRTEPSVEVMKEEANDLENMWMEKEAIILQFSEKDERPVLIQNLHLTMSRVSLYDKTDGTKKLVIFDYKSKVYMKNSSFLSNGKSEILNPNITSIAIKGSSSFNPDDCYIRANGNRSFLTILDSSSAFTNCLIETSLSAKGLKSVGLIGCAHSDLLLNNVTFCCTSAVFALESKSTISGCTFRQEHMGMTSLRPLHPGPLLTIIKGKATVTKSSFRQERSTECCCVRNSEVVITDSHFSCGHLGVVLLGYSDGPRNVLTFRNNEVYFLRPCFDDCHMVEAWVPCFIKFHNNEVFNQEELACKNIQVKDITVVGNVETNIVNYYSSSRSQLSVKDKYTSVNIDSDTNSELRLGKKKLSTQLTYHVTANNTHTSYHPDRLGKFGSSVCKRGMRLCQFCEKKEPNEWKTGFGYCGGCLVVSYCSQDCLRKDWKKNHEAECKDLQDSGIKFTSVFYNEKCISI